MHAPAMAPLDVGDHAANQSASPPVKCRYGRIGMFIPCIIIIIIMVNGITNVKGDGDGGEQNDLRER